ncbi:MAG: HipA N-terminal domain-containing protein [Candidatus Riflebacteria bacterium]|nr:HipA N-terminal domain-containing protein [Candidatus Riflebacteria bacterium]
MRTADIYIYGNLAGRLTEDENGYSFKYNDEYIAFDEAVPISKLFPLNQNEYRDRVLFPFFDGLIPEGWLLDIAEKNWKLDANDRMGLLLACCKDCIGAVSVVEVSNV